jgi:hypothetical protein
VLQKFGVKLDVIQSTPNFGLGFYSLCYTFFINGHPPDSLQLRGLKRTWLIMSTRLNDAGGHSHFFFPIKNMVPTKVIFGNLFLERHLSNATSDWPRINWL